MPPAARHVVLCLFLAVVAAWPFGLGWPPRLAALAGLAEPVFLGPVLAVGLVCAAASWRLRRTGTVWRATLWGAAAGFGAGALGALVGCLASGGLAREAFGSHLGCWAGMATLMAPYVAAWMAAFCAWGRWRQRVAAT